MENTGPTLQSRILQQEVQQPSLHLRNSFSHHRYTNEGGCRPTMGKRSSQEITSSRECTGVRQDHLKGPKVQHYRQPPQLAGPILSRPARTGQDPIELALTLRLEDFHFLTPPMLLERTGGLHYLVFRP